MDLERHAKESDIIISFVGAQSTINPQMIKVESSSNLVSVYYVAQIDFAVEISKSLHWDIISYAIWQTILIKRKNVIAWNDFNWIKISWLNNLSQNIDFVKCWDINIRHKLVTTSEFAEIHSHVGGRNVDS